MLAHSAAVETLSQLRQLVHDTLCHHEQFKPGVFPMTERVLTRGGRPCGLYFCLHGPRSTKCTSIWDTETNTLLFYGNRGERFHRTELTKAPHLQGSEPPD